MGSDFGMGVVDCCSVGDDGHYDKINTIKPTAHIKTKLMVKIDQQLDRYTNKMLEKKIHEIMSLKIGGFPIVKFPAPYKTQIDEKYDIESITISCCSNQNNKIYKLPVIDEYYGALNYVHKYDKYNKYEIKNDPSTKKFDSMQQATQWFDDMIHTPLYSTNHEEKEYTAMQNRQKLKYKLFNEWADINIQNISNKNQIAMVLFGSDEFTGNDEDMWLTFIAFSGFAAHRTLPMQPTDQHPGSYFKSDTTFLAAYKVRSGYKKYGAVAYFDNKYRIINIFLSHNKKTYTPNSYIKAEWEHAKWVWKVSVTVATFLVDMVAHCRFREASSLVTAVQTRLNVNHPIRRLLLPFTFGTVYSNRVLNEYLKENGLFHRVFAFKYGELSRLIVDVMGDAPAIEKGPTRSVADANKYIFRLLRKKVAVLKRMPAEVYPMYMDLSNFWTQTLAFVSQYVAQYYTENDEDDSELINDVELKAFYDDLLESCNIGKMYRLKKFNLINILTHFICNATVWHSHLSGAVSFDYFIDPNFNGLKICEGAQGNSIQNYAEYCIVVLCKGWNLMRFDGKTNNIIKELDFGYSLDAIWSKVLLDDDKLAENQKIFKQYFVDNMKMISKDIDNAGTIVPYHSMNPTYFGSTFML